MDFLLQKNTFLSCRVKGSLAHIGQLLFPETPDDSKEKLACVRVVSWSVLQPLASCGLLLADFMLLLFRD